MYIIYAHNIIIAYQVCKNADKKKQPPHKVTALIQNPKKPIVLYTTRPMRNNEVQGREYYFINEEKS